ncbi:MAG TPA: PA domain-containing protein, partial [Candidatus Methylomirabilis sp.]
IPAPPNTRINDVKVAHLETKSFKGDILIHSQEFCGQGFIPRLISNGAVAAPGQGGISIYDVTNPLKPRALKQNFLPFQVHNTFIYQQGDKAFVVVVDDENERDVHIVDITKPSAPREVAVTGQPDFEAIEPIDNIGVDEVFLHDVTVQQNNGRVIAYLSYWDGGLILIDITDPKNPVFLGDSDYLNPDPLSGVAPEGNSHAAWPNADGTRVLMGDEDFTKGVLTSFTFNGTSFPAVEGIFTFPVGLLPGGAFTGRVVWTGGLGCTPSEIPPAPAADSVALIQRGVCFFEEKADAAFAQGYSGFIVANDAARGDALVLMSPATEGPYPPIPGFFVGFSTGEAMKAAGAGNLGGTVAATGIFDGFGRLHLLDVTDPTSITELDGFATENVFAAQASGDRTMHNVIVEGTTAYISWYFEGMRVVSFRNDRLREVAHFVDTGPEGSNFWGVYLHHHPNGNTYILGSDRDTGLWIFETP